MKSLLRLHIEPYQSLAWTAVGGEVILPAENRKDLMEVPDHVRENMQFVFVEHICDALSAAIPRLAQKAGQSESGSGGNPCLRN